MSVLYFSTRCIARDTLYSHYTHKHALSIIREEYYLRLSSSFFGSSFFSGDLVCGSLGFCLCLCFCFCRSLCLGSRLSIKCPHKSVAKSLVIQSVSENWKLTSFNE